jgi:hypothetical protein
LTTEHISTPYLIRTPRGNVTTKQLVMATPLKLAGRLYKTNLIVLDGQEIDVILGMGCMKGHKALLDIAAQTVYLESPVSYPDPIGWNQSLYMCAQDVQITRTIII